mgnify:CR=1 FL=1
MTKVESNNTDKLGKEYFQLPIYHLADKIETDQNIISDLELVEYKDVSNNNVYKDTFKPSTQYGCEQAKKWSEYFTSNKQFLKDSQSLYTKYNAPLDIYDKERFEKVKEIWNLINDDDGFIDKYHYIDIGFLEKFNHESTVLQALTVYNLSAPLISLILPVIILIVPFFILKLKGLPISIAGYIASLKEVAGNHAVGRLFMQFRHVSWQQRFYLSISVAFYLFQIYQNTMTCVSFYKRMKLMHYNIFELKDYATHTIKKMDHLLSIIKNLKTYSGFSKEIIHYRETLINFIEDIKFITPFKNNINKVTQIGDVMKVFYELHSNKQYNEAMQFSFGFNGYIDNIYSLHTQLHNKRANTCSFTDKKTSFKEAFLPLFDESVVKNTYKLNKKMIITGPNAAGKTTLLKTTIFNILFTQQTGCGFYKTCKLNPYNNIHCYLNIPDTSGRDSLFQAEARRCKQIIDIINEQGKKSRHFAIFDELYSGTNPYEATASAHGFLEYLSGYKNVDLMLTTHYIELCKKIADNKSFDNYHMKINDSTDDILYTYKLTNGVSEIKGGLKVLKDLAYPSHILNVAAKNL